MLARLEHVNVTVSDPEATAALLARLFGWQVRWQGGAMGGGRSVHVGSLDQYVALYRAPGAQAEPPDADRVRGALNHIGVQVADLADAQARVLAAGLVPHSHADYEPGRRFYFNDADGVEYEVVSYA